MIPRIGARSAAISCGRGSMSSPNERADRSGIEPADDVDDAALERVMNDVPQGALALSGLTVGLLLLAWFLIYVLVFLPRGMVG